MISDLVDTSISGAPVPSALEFGREIALSVIKREYVGFERQHAVALLMRLHRRHGVGPAVAVLAEHLLHWHELVVERDAEVYSLGSRPVGFTRRQRCRGCDAFSDAATPNYVARLRVEAMVLALMDGGSRYGDACDEAVNLIACEEVLRS